MKIQLSNRIWKPVYALFASVLLVVTFQNCGKAGFDSSLDNSLTSASNSTSNAQTAQFGRDADKVAAQPFAFDIAPDQITYNSCTGSGLSGNPAFFTFKIGAYSAGGGVSLKPNFLNYLTTNFQPIFPATPLSDSQIRA